MARSPEIFGCYQEAAQLLAQFPLSIDGWEALEASVQYNLLGNVIEAFGALGITTDAPGVGLLLEMNEWALQLADSSEAEISLLRTRARLAARLQPHSTDVELVLTPKGRTRTFIGSLVALDTLLHPTCLEAGLVSQEALAIRAQEVERLLDGQEHRPEDGLFAYAVLSRVPSTAKVTQRRDVATAMVRAVAATPLGSGRFRALAFASECLARLGKDYADAHSELIGELHELAPAAIRQRSAVALTDHRFPRAFMKIPTAVSVYNACLLIRNSRYSMIADSHQRLCRTTRQELFFQGLPLQYDVAALTHRIAMVVPEIQRSMPFINGASDEGYWRDAIVLALRQNQDLQVGSEERLPRGSRLDLTVRAPRQGGEDLVWCIEFKRFSYALRMKADVGAQLERYAASTGRHVVLVLIRDNASRVDSRTMLQRLGDLGLRPVSGVLQSGPATHVQLCVVVPTESSSRSVAVSVIVHDPT